MVHSVHAHQDAHSTLKVNLSSPFPWVGCDTGRICNCYARTKLYPYPWVRVLWLASIKLMTANTTVSNVVGMIGTEAGLPVSVETAASAMVRLLN